MPNQGQNKKKITEATAQAKVKITDISLFEIDSQHLWGCHIGRPQRGEKIDSGNNEITIAGWVLGKSSRAVAVEIISEGNILQTVSIDKQRPGVAKAFPSVEKAKNSGFSTKVGVPQKVSGWEMLLQAILEDESRIPIGEIRMDLMSLPPIRRVYIRGCARSGNTLMMYLCGTGFKNSYILEPEQVPFPEVSPPDKITFGKLPRPGRRGKKPRIRADNFLAAEDAAIIFMMRDPRDILLSEHGMRPGRPFHQSPDLWIKNALFFQNLEHNPRLVLVKYEDLLTKPNEIQEKIATALGLEIAIPFSECWKHFQPNQSNIKALNGVRPLDQSSIGKWKQDSDQREYINNQLRDWPDIFPLMKHFGYEPEDMVDNLNQTALAQTTEIIQPPTVETSDTPTSKKWKLSVCAIMKNEGHYLVEWLEFHKLVGVERFYLYNNNSTDNTLDILDAYTERGEVILHDWPLQENQQSEAYTHCLEHYKTETEWIAFIDLDEFLFPTEKNNLQEVLEEFVEYPGIGVNWLNFGPSGHEKQPKGLQIENYTRRSKASFPGNKHIKSIVRPEKTIAPLNPHQFSYIDGLLAVAENYQEINGFKTEIHSVEKLRINHYTTRSKEESRKKMMRGTIYDNKQKQKWSFYEARHKMFDVEEDLTIQRFLPDVKKKTAAKNKAEIITSNSTIIKIINVKYLEPVSESLLDFQLNQPAKGAKINTYSIEIAGWVLGKNSPVEILRLINQGKVIRKVAVNRNTPEVGKLYPENQQAKHCGFSTAVGLTGLPLKSEIIVEAILPNKTQIPIAIIEFQRLTSLTSSYQPTLQPLALTCLGRSGTTWLMKLLSEHPNIIVSGGYPYETLSAQYWIHLFKVISEPANSLESTPKLHYFANKSNWIGHHPFYEISDNYEKFSWFGVDYTKQVATFCQESIDKYYQNIAQTQGKTVSLPSEKITYFAEKYHANFPHILQNLSELYADFREIILVRDFRDVLCSMLAFNAKRNKDGFGIKSSQKPEDFVSEFGKNSVMPLLDRWRKYSSQVHLLRYEDLIQFPVETLSATFEYLELDNSSEVITKILEKVSQDTTQLERHKTSSNPEASIGRWQQELSPELKAVCNHVFAEVLSEFGYTEKTDIQVTRIPNIKPEIPQKKTEPVQTLIVPVETGENTKCLATLGKIDKVLIENQFLQITGWVFFLNSMPVEGFKVSINNIQVDNIEQTFCLPSPGVKKHHPRVKGAAKARFKLTIRLNKDQIEQYKNCLVILTPKSQGLEGGVLIEVLNPNLKIFLGDDINKSKTMLRQLSYTSLKWLGYLIQRIGLKPTDSIMDLGYGLDNIAYGLVYYLTSQARYEGLDFSETVIKWAQQEITSKKPNFNFQYQDIYHPIYNSQGTVPITDYILPYPEASFDVICISNLFYHLSSIDIRHCLQQIQRVLKVSGKCLFACFLINSESQKLIANHKSSQDLVHEIEGGFCLDPELPEKTIGFQESLVMDWIEESGLTIVDKYYGSWCERKSFTYQDLVIVEKKTQFKSKRQTYKTFLAKYKSKFEKIQL
ncbi:MAG: glycosyltransferase family 92 protein [Microcoleaceae cyanobacterium MO_207.B10]|nr:glycosyltransferase family 92 protein [Microcoleaceae cyanobacterium MO_207.B10]